VHAGAHAMEVSEQALSSIYAMEKNYFLVKGSFEII
jgi:hypothetical protein